MISVSLVSHTALSRNIFTGSAVVISMVTITFLGFTFPPFALSVELFVMAVGAQSVGKQLIRCPAFAFLQSLVSAHVHGLTLPDRGPCLYVDRFPRRDHRRHVVPLAVPASRNP